jgi:hypothetical protein
MSFVTLNRTSEPPIEAVAAAELGSGMTLPGRSGWARYAKTLVAGSGVDLTVDHREFAGGLDRTALLAVVIRLILDADEDAVPLVLLRHLCGRIGETGEVLAVLNVVRVELARHLDLVLQIASGDVHAFRLGLPNGSLAVFARGERDGESEGEESKSRTKARHCGRNLSEAGCR